MLYLVLIPSLDSSTYQSLICSQNIHLAAQILNVSSTTFTNLFIGKVQVSHYLVYQVWFYHVLSPIYFSL